MKSAILSLLLAVVLVGNSSAQVEDKAILVFRHGEDIDNGATNSKGQYNGTPTTAPNNRPWYNTANVEATFVYASSPDQRYHVPYPHRWHGNVNTNWPVYFANANHIIAFGDTPMSFNDDVSAVLHGLSVEANAGNSNYTNPYLGEFQAEALAAHLDDFVSTTISCAPIARIFTKDLRNKRGSYPTPNPFDTVYPYYKDHPNTTLYLSRKSTSDFTGGIFDAIKTNLFTVSNTNLPNLLASPGSAIICWDRQGLWGTSGGPNNASSILSKLYSSKAFNLSSGAIAAINSLGQPGKASRIYAFIQRKSGTNVTKEVKVYNVVYSNTTGTNYPPAYSVKFNQVFPSQ
jgi:hypothetical protein